MPSYRVEVRQKKHAALRSDDSAFDGRPGVGGVCPSHVYLIDGELTRGDIEEITHTLLCDPVAELAQIAVEGDSLADDPLAFEVHPKPGVMDPVAESLTAELHAAGYAIKNVRTARRYSLRGATGCDRVPVDAPREFANDCIEDVHLGAPRLAPGPRPPQRACELRHVALRGLDAEQLNTLSRTKHLFLSPAEMQAICAYYREAGREPTDLELETLAQTWSEHCVHKTLKSAVRYEGDPIPFLTEPAAGEVPAPASASHDEPATYECANLLKDTIARATEELIAAGRGPECLSVFVDNAGIIAFDDEYAVAFKVETHNHPSAIEPYGGAATGIGGCIRDVLGCGLGARPIANTDVFCVAPSDWPPGALPRGVLHPDRVLRGVVRGVADYGNRMGIPTVNGAVVFDPRYLGNPLVYCGCIGLLPRDRIKKAAMPGDKIVLLGGRTGRDGIHGATFSSAELTDGHADEFSHAVQIGNAITEKRCLDAVLAARNDGGECLYNAITDCGAGGLSSAVGEMGEEVGALVDLETVPLKYPGLRYDEIWISEAQERMVLAVPPQRLDTFLQIARDEEVEATVIGAFGERDPLTGAPRLIARYNGQVVGELDMRFLHHGVPRTTRNARWTRTRKDIPAQRAENNAEDRLLTTELLAALRRPNVAAKEWIVRQYDHEVQGGSVVKPFCGPGDGPADAAVLRPRRTSRRGVAVGCGLRPELSAIDPYWMALASIDEAIRNIVAVGGDPRRTALLDNFCWGRCDDETRMGALVRACRACYDGAIAYGAPFISGKDSLNNEFALAADDTESLLATLRKAGIVEVADLDDLDREVRATGRLRITDTLLISAISIVEDVECCVTSDFKARKAIVQFVGGLPEIEFDPAHAVAVHHAVADAIAAGWVSACHDVSDGGWLVALAEMAIGGRIGADLIADEQTRRSAFQPMCAGYLMTVWDAAAAEAHFRSRSVRARSVARLRDDRTIVIGSEKLTLEQLSRAWRAQTAPRT